MWEQLTGYLSQLNTAAQSNQFLAAGLSMYGLGVLTYFLRNVPLRIWNFIKRQATTSLSFTSAGIGTNMETFGNFLTWYEKKRWSKFSRSISLTGMWTHGDNVNDGTVVGPGDGKHFFFYKNRPCWMTRSRMQEGTGFQVTYEIQITMLGRNRQAILDMVEEFRYKPGEDTIGVYIMNGEGWIRLADVTKRPLKTVVIKREMKEQLVGTIKRWMDSKDWYTNRGLPYKLTIVLTGLPGTGKTSLIKALASHFRMNVCMINLSLMTDHTFERALSTAPANSFVVIEDFDSSTATHARKALVGKVKSKETTATKDGDVSETTTETTKAGDSQNLLSDLMGASLLTLSGILNALDGILSLDGKIVFMTTNVYETLDPALIRKGRVDYTYELTKLSHAEIRDYIELMFPGAVVPSDVVYEDALGCDLQDLYFHHRDDAAAFVAAIPQRDLRGPRSIPYRFESGVVGLDRDFHPQELSEGSAIDEYVPKTSTENHRASASNAS